MQVILKSPRRVRKSITKDFQPNPLQENNDFNEKVKEFLSRDYEFINRQRTCTAKDGLPYCTLYEESYLKNSLINMQKTLSTHKVASKLIARYELIVRRKLQKINENNNNFEKIYSEYKFAFESLGLSIPKSFIL